MRSILPVHALEAKQSYESFVRQTGGLEGVRRLFPFEVVLGETPQLGVHDGNELVQSFLTSIAPPQQELGHVPVGTLMIMLRNGNPNM